MPTCFMIQPFDKGKFDKRYLQVFKPAIKAADLEPYRVDEDIKADVLIESIEKGIASAVVCLADISTDNPNVWYELGYAMATAKTVVMVCSNEREKYPFDIQHRRVISYSADAPGDFDALQHTITAKLKAAVEKSEALDQLSTSTVAPVAGLSQNELTLLGVVAAEVGTPNGWANVWDTQKRAYRDGLTNIGFSVAMRKLLTKKLLVTEDLEDGDYIRSVLRVTDAGWNWIEDNEHHFVLRSITDEDIPF